MRQCVAICAGAERTRESGAQYTEHQNYYHSKTSEASLYDNEQRNLQTITTIAWYKLFHSSTHRSWKKHCLILTAGTL